MSFRVYSFVHFICHMVIIFFLTNHEYLIDINNINISKDNLNLDDKKSKFNINTKKIDFIAIKQ